MIRWCAPVLRSITPLSSSSASSPPRSCPAYSQLLAQAKCVASPSRAPRESCTDCGSAQGEEILSRLGRCNTSPAIKINGPRTPQDGARLTPLPRKWGVVNAQAGIHTRGRRGTGQETRYSSKSAVITANLAPNSSFAILHFMLLLLNFRHLSSARKYLRYLYQKS